MSDVNIAVLTGRIGTELELKATGGGVSVLSFPLAVERMRAKGAERAEVDWIDVVLWRQAAEFAARYLGRGRRVVVRGCLRTSVWEDKAGSKHKTVELHADGIVPADSRPDGGAGKSDGQAAPSAGAAPVADAPSFDPLPDDEELPF